MLLQSIFFCIGIMWHESNGQYTPFSLQSAVNALHRQEVDLALKDNYPTSRYTSPEDDDYGESYGRNPSRANLNRLLAKYLQRDDEDNDESYDDFDDGNLFENEIKKRSFFRERDGKEVREFQPSMSQKKLAQEFLKEIEDQRRYEEEQAYKESLRRLWDKYRQQENEIADEIYGDEKKRFVVPTSEAGGGVYIGPLMQKKRSYPVLPWLPYSKKKRFPVSKRSPKMPIEPFSAVNSQNNNNIAKDLEEIFGNEKETKKKRAAETVPSINPTEKSKKDHLQQERKGNENSEAHNHHSHHGSRNESEESHEHSHEGEGSDEHGDDHDEDTEEDHGEGEDDEEMKKKRSIADEKKKKSVKTPNKEIVKEDQIIPGDLSNYRKKKSIDWSQYWGIDRKKKSKWQNIRKKLAAIRKRSPVNSDRIGGKPKKKALDEEKIESMDSKLKSIQDLIIDETIKYTGAHEGITRPDEIREVKDHVLSRLATAYNLEKMRRALNKIRQSIEDENHLQKNEIETDNSKEKAKRVAVKKNDSQMENNNQVADEKTSGKTTESSNQLNNSQEDDSEEGKKKKKKRNGGGNIRFLDVENDIPDFDEDDDTGHYESHNDVYLGRQSNGPIGNQCPIIDSMSEKCRGIELLSGDINQELLPVCGVHQLCYLCGTSQVACDLQYLSDADTICGRNSDCQSVARSVLMILRGTSGSQLGPRECLKNPCLYRAMREIGL